MRAERDGRVFASSRPRPEGPPAHAPGPRPPTWSPALKYVPHNQCPSPAALTLQILCPCLPRSSGFLLGKAPATGAHQLAVLRRGRGCAWPSLKRLHSVDGLGPRPRWRGNVGPRLFSQIRLNEPEAMIKGSSQEVGWSFLVIV